MATHIITPIDGSGNRPGRDYTWRVMPPSMRMF
jgi:hypothetical protein